VRPALLQQLFWLAIIFSVLRCTPAAEAQQDPVLLELGTRQITLNQFNESLNLTCPGLEQRSATEQKILKTAQMREIIERELILNEADKLHIRLTPEELEAELASVRGDYSAEEFRQILALQGTSEHSWLNALQARLLAEKVSRRFLQDRLQVTQRETEDYYRSHIQDFERPEQVRVRQILFSTAEKAQQIRRIACEGGSFAALAGIYSQSPDRDHDGYLGIFSRGELPREFDRILFNLPVKQVSRVVKSPYGFHLFLVERKYRAGRRPYELVKEEILQLLRLAKEEQLLRQWHESLRLTTRMQINWSLLDPAPLD